MVQNKKNLNEQVADVMSSAMSNRMKQNELLKLGITSDEIYLLLHTKAWQASGFDIRRLTFGVEIECYNVLREELIGTASANGLQVRSEGYNHDDSEHFYRIVRDGSLTGDNSQEVVSPILNGERGFDSLRTLCDALASVGARVNRSCGLHVHIGAANMSDAHYIRVFKNYQAIEKAIDTFMAPSRRGNNNGYSKTLQGVSFSACSTKRDVAAVLGFDRYRKVNAEAYGRHQTIEFRQHQGSTDYEKISHWVRFLAKLVEYSFKHDCPSCSMIEEIPFLSDEEKSFFTARRAALN
jgi:Putative amidoligase enzyme.